MIDVIPKEKAIRNTKQIFQLKMKIEYLLFYFKSVTVILQTGKDKRTLMPPVEQHEYF